MTETLAAVPPQDDAVPDRADEVALIRAGAEESASVVMPSERAMIAQLVRAARARGDDLTGPDGLLKLLTKTVLETALDEDMNDHLGYDKHAVEGRNSQDLWMGVSRDLLLTS